MKEKQDIYISEAILWDIVKQLKRLHPNDTELGKRVRDLVSDYG